MTAAALLRLMLAFAVAHGEPIPTTQVRSVAVAIHRVTRDPVLQAAVAVACWRESHWTRYGQRPCGCGARRELAAQVSCAAGTLGYWMRRCSTTVEAFGAFHHGDGCRADGYGTAAAGQLAAMLATGVSR